MSNAAESISRYFQLTPEILVEYTYNNVSRMYDMHGDATGYIRDLAENQSNGGTQAYVVNNGYLGSRTFLWKSEKNKFVIPVNKSESKFISYRPEDVNGDVHAIPFESSGNEDMNEDADEDKGEDETIYYINEAWEGTKIGEEIYVNMRPTVVQYNRLSNPSRCHFGIVGSRYNFNNSKPF